MDEDGGVDRGDLDGVDHVVEPLAVERAPTLEAGHLAVGRVEDEAEQEQAGHGGAGGDRGTAESEDDE